MDSNRLERIRDRLKQMHVSDRFSLFDGSFWRVVHHGWPVVLDIWRDGAVWMVVERYMPSLASIQERQSGGGLRARYIDIEILSELVEATYGSPCVLSGAAHAIVPFLHAVENGSLRRADNSGVVVDGTCIEVTWHHQLELRGVMLMEPDERIAEIGHAVDACRSLVATQY